MHARVLLPFALLASATVAQLTTSTSSVTESAPRVVTSCHLDGSEFRCMDDERTYSMETIITATTDLPDIFSRCHSHASSFLCVGPSSVEVAAHAITSTPTGLPLENDGHNHREVQVNDAVSGVNKTCHTYQGSLYCTAEGQEALAGKCEAPKRDYNIRLRVGLLFVIFATSALGVFGPIFLQKTAMGKVMTFIFTFLKQFGTGIVVATSFVHLYTHASLMFAHECLGELGYEATTSVIVMAGLLISFVVEFVGHRIVSAKEKSMVNLSMEERAKSKFSAETVTILVLEIGVLFHSLLIGLTLVVADDDDFGTLFVVILFHQMFEGLALGTRIATIGTKRDATAHTHEHADHEMSATGIKTINSSSSQMTGMTIKESIESHHVVQGLPFGKKLSLASLFAFITPMGMAIGIGVLQRFNGNDRSTIIAIGTLNALSAGILIWVGVVEMWAGDWMVGSHGQQAELAEANTATVTVAGSGLIGGMVLMSVLGKWA